MNSQNRMNAGAEYVLCRIWAALQDQKGLHAESLLTCLGALAGYACQVCVRQTAALPGADRKKYALVPVESADGMTYLHGEALNGPLTDSPLSSGHSSAAPSRSSASPCRTSKAFSRT